MQEEFNTTTPEKAPHKRLQLGPAGYVALLLAAVIASIMLTFSLTVTYFFDGGAENKDFYRKFEVLTKYIEKNANFDADIESMQDAALKAYVANAGDRYTVYYNADDFKALREDDEGRYVGIGITVAVKDVMYNGDVLSLVEIIKVHEGSSAQDVGLTPGDLIYSVDTLEGEVFADDVGFDVLSSKIKGEAGTEVTITLLRETGGEMQMHKVTLERRSVEVDSVSCLIDSQYSDVGIVSIFQFDLNTPMLFSNAVSSLCEQGVKKLVIDLRDNGGGDLNSVIACASYFLDNDDLILSAEDNKGDVVKYKARARTYGGRYASCSVTAEDIGKFKNIKVVVLVNENTASAAELLTAVFRDYGLAPIIGVNTFGKGTMQTIYSLDAHGIDGGMKITTDVYFPPCGENYDGVGILPDVVVELDDSAEDNQLKTAIEILNK